MNIVRGWPTGSKPGEALLRQQLAHQNRRNRIMFTDLVHGFVGVIASPTRSVGPDRTTRNAQPQLNRRVAERSLHAGVGACQTESRHQTNLEAVALGPSSTHSRAFELEPSLPRRCGGGAQIRFDR